MGGRREGTGSRIGADVRMVLAKMAGWIDVDAHMRFDGNKESQAEILHAKANNNIRYSESFHGILFVA